MQVEKYKAGYKKEGVCPANTKKSEGVFLISCHVFDHSGSGHDAALEGFAKGLLVLVHHPRTLYIFTKD
jgi:hypothetical protein